MDKNDQKRDITHEVISSYRGRNLQHELCLIFDLQNMGEMGKKCLKKAQKRLRKAGVDQSVAKKFCFPQNK